MGYSLYSTDADCYEGTSVLKNKLNIKNEQQLKENEGLITGIKSVAMLAESMKQNFCFDDYKNIHKELFDDLYEWAGKLRTIHLSKAGTHFVAPENIEDLGCRIFERIKTKKYFKGLNQDDFVDEITDLYHSLNMLHPFREGNGRTQRIFFVQLIRNAGYDIDYSELTSELLMIGTIQAASGIMDNLKSFFKDNIKN